MRRYVKVVPAPHVKRYRAVSRVGVEERPTSREAVEVAREWLSAGPARHVSIEVFAYQFGWWPIERWTVDGEGTPVSVDPYIDGARDGEVPG